MEDSLYCGLMHHGFYITKYYDNKLVIYSVTQLAKNHWLYKMTNLSISNSVTRYIKVSILYLRCQCSHIFICFPGEQPPPPEATLLVFLYHLACSVWSLSEQGFNKHK